MISGLALLEREIRTQITDVLDKIGILYRIFSRTKDPKSIEDKIIRKEKDNVPYSASGKLMQDVIGIRIATYFRDDVEIVYSILKTRLNYYSEEIDNHDLTVFKPKRTNIIFKFNSKHFQIFKEVQKSTNESYFDLIDNTFELQLRTILSEGWHEIDHSLRYKCKEDWASYKENERMLNGIYANLETNDIALKSLFNELAYKHYKNSNWEGLIRNKFRLNFQLVPLNDNLIKILNRNGNLGKQIFRLTREILVNKMCSMEISIPINLSNIVYIINAFHLKNEEIFKITPKVILSEFNIIIN